MVHLCVLTGADVLISEDRMDVIGELTDARHNVSGIAASSDKFANCLFLGSLWPFVVLPFR